MRLKFRKILIEVGEGGDGRCQKRGGPKSLTIYPLKLIPPGKRGEEVHISKEEVYLKRLREYWLKGGCYFRGNKQGSLSRKISLRIGENMLALDEGLVKTVMVTPAVCLHESLKERLYYDLLTLCYKRDFAEDILEQFVRISPTSFAQADLDDFKRINDTYRHSFGDQVLREVGLTLRKKLRKHDLVIRWGGEEFLIGLPKTPEDLAIRICERLRQAIASLKLKWNNKIVPITLKYSNLSTRNSRRSSSKIIWTHTGA